MKDLDHRGYLFTWTLCKHISTRISNKLVKNTYSTNSTISFIWGISLCLFLFFCYVWSDLLSYTCTQTVSPYMHVLQVNKISIINKSTLVS